MTLSSLEISNRFIDAVCPDRGVILNLLELYVDESGTHDGSPALSVGGYLFHKDSVKQFNEKWAEVLEKYSLPYFRMSSCAHGNGPFKGMRKNERVEVEKELIEIVKKYSMEGYCVVMNEDQFHSIMGDDFPLTPYSVCLQSLLMAVGYRLDILGLDVDVAYFFEAGHRSQRQANDMMMQYAQQKASKRAWRYVSHSFVEKTKLLPLQAADIYAWQTYTLVKNNGIELNNPKVRKDFEALLRPQDQIDNFTPKRLEMYAAHTLQNYGVFYPHADIAKGKEVFVYKRDK